jgi:predicted RNA-binding Zn-ribbon protein involved in translation (DUF1610 family)
MKKTYDYDEYTKTCTCPVCGYKCTKDLHSSYRPLIEGDDEFVKMDFTLHSEDNANYYSGSRSHTMYACPKCGVLQLET